MKRIAFALTVGIGLVATTAIARADCSTSYVILPSGRCLDLSYTTLLGASRDNQAISNNSYQQLFNANVTLDIHQDLTKETKEEREERIKVLAVNKRSNDSVNASAKKIEDMLYPVHLRAMDAIRREYNK